MVICLPTKSCGKTPLSRRWTWTSSVFVYQYCHDSVSYDNTWAGQSEPTDATTYTSPPNLPRGNTNLTIYKIVCQHGGVVILACPYQFNKY